MIQKNLEKEWDELMDFLNEFDEALENLYIQEDPSLNLLYFKNDDRTKERTVKNVASK